jgi:hypothetical protein
VSRKYKLAERVASLETANQFIVREFDLRDRFEQRSRATEVRALDLALENINYRLAGMNEFRQQINDAEAKFISRDEVQLIDSRTSGALAAMRDSMDSRFRGLERLVYMAVGAVALITSIAEYFIRQH